MLIFENENRHFDMTVCPEELEEDIYYGVLDYQDQDDVDFRFFRLLYVDQFSRPAADLNIGGYRLQMPLDWSVVIGDKNLGNIEIIELSQINDRDFEVFCFNPLTSSMPEFLEITVENTFPDIQWNPPRLDAGHLLTVPLRTGHNPLCAFFVRDTNKIPDSLDISKLF